MTRTVDTQPMTEADLDMVLSWAAEEGWNPGHEDAAAFHAADPGGFFLTRVDGAPVAAVSVVNHDAYTAFLGLYLCRPDWRGTGLGLATWQTGMAHAGSRSVGLDGVPEQQDNYARSGFVKTGATLRHEGRVAARRAPHVRAATADDTAALAALDRVATGHARSRFLKAWLDNREDQRGTRVLQADGAALGFATWRACPLGTKIGPVIAPDTATALDLIGDIAALRPDGPLVVDIPEANTDLRRALTDQGFTIPFVTARMWRGPAPRTGPGLQAIATMELG